MYASRCLLLGTTLCFSLPLYAATARGKVIGSDNTPISGATIVIVAGAAKAPVKVQSSKDGTWTAEVPDIQLSVQAARMSEATKAQFRQFIGIAFVMAPGKGFSQTILQRDKPNETQLYPAASVGGTVQDGKNAPVAGAVVRIQGIDLGKGEQSIYIAPDMEKLLGSYISTKTDAQGKWKIDGLRQGSQVTVKLADERYAQSQTSIGAGSLNAILKAVPGATLKGRVVYPDGKPAANLMVSGNGSYNNTTDADGRFALTNLPPGRPWYQISDPKNEWLIQPKQVETLAEGQIYDVGEMKLSKGVLVKGKILDSAGKPLAGASVSGSGMSESGTTDKLGNYQFRSLPGTNWMWVAKDGYLPLSSAERQVKIGAGQTEQTLAPIKLKRGVYILGMARDKAGKPAVGATIANGDRWTSDGEVAQATVEKSGKFKLGPLVPGQQITLTTEDNWDFVSPTKVTAPTLQQADKFGAKTPILPVTLQKIKPYEVSGRVVSPEGKPLADVNFRFAVYLNKKLNSWQNREVSSNAKGIISFSGLRPEHSPKVERLLSDGFVLVKTPKPTRTGNKWNLGDIVVSTLDGTIKGVVLGADGAPIPDAKVAIAGEITPKVISTDEQGRFAFDKLPKGNVTLLTAKDHSFTRQTVSTGQDITLRLENHPAPTAADGLALLQNKQGGNSGYILATGVPAIEPSVLPTIIKRTGDNRPDATAMAVVLGALARRSPEIAAKWGVEQWAKLNHNGMDAKVALSSGYALARAAALYNPPFATAWFNDVRAKMLPNDFSADAADKYFMLAGIAGLIKRPEAAMLVDLGLTAADNAVHGETRDEKLSTWGEALCSSPELLTRLTQEMSPVQRMKVQAGVVEGLARTDTDAAAKALAELVKLCNTPEVKADDAKILADREKSHIWRETSSNAVNDAQLALIAALAKKPGPAALEMAKELDGAYQQAPAMLYIARYQLAAGRKDEALATLRAMPDEDENSLTRAASLALPLDKALATQMFQRAYQQFFVNESWSEDYRPGGASYGLYHAALDPADSWVRLEAEWAWRQKQLDAGKNPGNHEDQMRSIAIAMGTLDLPRAQEMLASIKTNSQQNEFAMTYIGLYLASNGQTNPINPWQDNRF